MEHGGVSSPRRDHRIVVPDELVEPCAARLVHVAVIASGGLDSADGVGDQRFSLCVVEVVRCDEQDVDVAVWARVAASDGSEQRGGDPGRGLRGERVFDGGADASLHSPHGLVGVCHESLYRRPQQMLTVHVVQHGLPRPSRLDEARVDQAVQHLPCALDGRACELGGPLPGERQARAREHAQHASVHTGHDHRERVSEVHASTILEVHLGR